MAPLQSFYLISILVVFAVAWFRGGHPERAGVVALLLTYVAGPFVFDLNFGRMRAGIALADVALLVALVWLSLRYDRWWLLFASAAQTLSVVSHAALLVNAEVTPRENMAAQWVFGLLALYALLAGVGERWLAGEAVAAPPLRRWSGPARESLEKPT